MMMMMMTTTTRRWTLFLPARAGSLLRTLSLYVILILVAQKVQSAGPVINNGHLGSLIHSSTGSTCDISRRSAITRAAMQSLENQIWRSRLAISTKLKLYNTCFLPIFL